MEHAHELPEFLHFIEELKSELFEKIFKKNPIKKYDFSKFQLEVSTICRRCN